MTNNYLMKGREGGRERGREGGREGGRAKEGDCLLVVPKKK